MSTSDERRGNGVRVLAATGVGMSVAFVVAAAIGGQLALGLATGAVGIVFTAVAVLASRRFELVRGLLNRRDERFAGIDTLATASAGHVLIVAVILGALVELARGNSGTPYIWLAALAGIGYVTRAVVERIRH
jgi:hypothetical protein